MPGLLPIRFSLSEKKATRKAVPVSWLWRICQDSLWRIDLYPRFPLFNCNKFKARTVTNRSVSRFTNRSRPMYLFCWSGINNCKRHSNNNSPLSHPAVWLRRNIINASTAYADDNVPLHPEEPRHEGGRQGCGTDCVWKNGATGKMWIRKKKSYPLHRCLSQMIDHIRKVKRIQLREEFSEETRGRKPASKQFEKILDEALNRLNDAQRSLVMLKGLWRVQLWRNRKDYEPEWEPGKVYLHRARVQLKGIW